MITVLNTDQYQNIIFMMCSSIMYLAPNIQFRLAGEVVVVARLKLHISERSWKQINSCKSGFELG